MDRRDEHHKQFIQHMRQIHDGIVGHRKLIDDCTTALIEDDYHRCNEIAKLACQSDINGPIKITGCLLTLVCEKLLNFRQAHQHEVRVEEKDTVVTAYTLPATKKSTRKKQITFKYCATNVNNYSSLYKQNRKTKKENVCIQKTENQTKTSSMRASDEGYKREHRRNTARTLITHSSGLPQSELIQKNTYNINKELRIILERLDSQVIKKYSRHSEKGSDLYDKGPPVNCLATNYELHDDNFGMDASDDVDLIFGEDDINNALNLCDLSVEELEACNVNMILENCLGKELSGVLEKYNEVRENEIEIE